MTKLRLLNGMSTLAAPLTLSVDFSPVIEGTLLGQVSDEIEIAARHRPAVRRFEYVDRAERADARQHHAAGELGLHVLHDRQRRDADRRAARDR